MLSRFLPLSLCIPPTAVPSLRQPMPHHGWHLPACSQGLRRRGDSGRVVARQRSMEQAPTQAPSVHPAS
eukprot:5723516-Pyramimonas_sp.AAC.1